MPRTYRRKTDRASWSQISLTEAVNQISENKMNIWNASKYYGIPYRTLKRRINENNSNKGALGRPVSLGSHEPELVAYIQKMESTGFLPTATAVRKLAFTFKNNLPNKFNQNNEIAGYDWFRNFMIRHPKLSIRKAEGISIARGLGMCREEVNNYFQLLSKICEENNLFNRPSKIYNVDETDLQLNNNLGKVVATKGSREVHHVTSAEKGETISVIACCNAEGNFLPPYCIFKGQRKKPEFEDGLPPGSRVEMGQTSAHVNCQLFLAWLKDHFVPRKQNGKVLLILDGHTSHCSDVNVLDFAAENEIILLCLPSRTTHYLQPLDRSFFKPLKTYWQRAVTYWITGHPGRRLTRYQFGGLLCNAWSLAATVSNCILGFKACGIFPYDPAQIPEHAFRISSASETLKDTSTQPESEDPNTLLNNRQSTDMSQVNASPVQFVLAYNENFDEPSATSVSCTFDQATASTSTSTPLMSFEEIAPVPALKKLRATKRKQHAQELTSQESREKVRENELRNDEDKKKQKLSVIKKEKKVKIIKKEKKVKEENAHNSSVLEEKVEMKDNKTATDIDEDNVITALHATCIIIPKMVQSVIG